MEISELLKKKREKNISIKDKYKLFKKDKALGLIKLTNKNIIKDLRDGLLELPISFVIELEGAETEKIGKNIIATSKLDKRDIIGFDFVICDDEIAELRYFLDKGVAPIISANNHFKTLLKDFNPVRNEGNAFFYNTNNKWSIYGALVRYNENYKFPFDNKNLVKNILKV